MFLTIRKFITCELSVEKYKLLKMFDAIFMFVLEYLQNEQNL